MNYLILIAGILAFIYIERRLNLFNRYLDSDATSLTFNVDSLTRTHPWVRAMAGVTEVDLKDLKSKHGKKSLKKLWKFMDEKESNFGDSCIFRIVYVPATRMFYIHNAKQHTMTMPLKWGQNTSLYDVALRYFPRSKYIEELSEPEIALSVVYRDHKYITVGLKKYKKGALGIKYKYEKIFDFPINFTGFGIFAKPNKYKKYGFEHKTDFIGPYENDFGKFEGNTLHEFKYKKRGYVGSIFFFE